MTNIHVVQKTFILELLRAPMKIDLPMMSNILCIIIESKTGAKKNDVNVNEIESKIWDYTFIRG